MTFKNTTREAKWVLLIFGATFWATLTLCALLQTHPALEGVTSSFGLLVFGALWITGVIFSNRFSAIVATIGGVVLASATVSTDVPTHVRALIDQDRCGPHDPKACFDAAVYYDTATTFAGGMMDAKRFYKKACRYGDARGCPEQRPKASVDPTANLSNDRLCELNNWAKASRACLAGDQQACEIRTWALSSERSLVACINILDRGFYPDQQMACENIDDICFSKRDRTCEFNRLRCGQIQQPMPY